MTFSEDLRWRTIVLSYVYSISDVSIAAILGCHVSTLNRWTKQFRQDGNVMIHRTRQTSSRWPRPVIEFVEQYAKDHPTFYLVELQSELHRRFPAQRNISTPTICRALRFDLNLSRKKLCKRAREAQPVEIDAFYARLSTLCTNNDQLVFVDETSKDGRSSIRHYAWSRVNTRAVVDLPFSRGKRVSVLAAMDITGFIAWETTRGTFTRKSFHAAMIKAIISRLNPYPLPRSIVVLDNARIHMYKELLDAIYAVGALAFFLPPYCPQFNPIELGFGMLKKWIIKNANLAFPLYPEKVLEICMPRLYLDAGGCRLSYIHCGYGDHGLIQSKFQLDRPTLSRSHMGGQ